MASTTSLLKTQKSRQQAIWDQEDQIADYEWSLSDKSPEALAAYKAHYTDRANNPQADPSKALTYIKKQTAANKAYTSNEIQRASIDIIEGRQPEEYKIQVLEQLYVQAYENGDLDLAQGLRLQLDNQYVKMQNAALAAQNAAGGGSGSSANIWKDYTDGVTANMSDLKNGNVPIPGADVLLADGTPLTPAKLSQYIKDYGIGYANDIVNKVFSDPKALEESYGKNATPMDVIYGTISGGYNELKNQIEQIDDPKIKMTMMSGLNQQMEGDTIDIAGTKMSIAALYNANAYAAENPNNSPFSFPIENGKTKVVLNKPAGHFWQFDENGNFMELPLYAGGTDKSGLRTSYDQTNISGEMAGYKTGEKLQYRIGATGSIELVPADEVRGKNGEIQSGKEMPRVDRTAVLGSPNASWGDVLKMAVAAPYIGLTGLAASFGIGTKENSKNKNQTAQSLDQLLAASGLVKRADGSYDISESARLDFTNRGITDFNPIAASDIQLAPDGSIQITRRAQDGTLKIMSLDTTPRSTDANGNPVLGWNEAIGVDQQMTVNDLVTQPAQAQAQFNNQPNTNNYLSSTAKTIADLKYQTPLEKNQIRLDQLKAEQAIARNSVPMGSISVPAYSPPKPIAVTPARVIQPAAPARAIQPAAPARLFQPAINPQPAGNGVNVNQLVAPNATVKVDNVNPNRFSVKVN